MFQRAGAGRASGADRIRPDDHLWHAWRAESRAWRDVHARRLRRLGRLCLFWVLHRGRDRGVPLCDAGRRADGAADHSPFLFPPERGPASRHLRPRHSVRGDCALLLRQPVEVGAAAAGRHHAARLHGLSYLSTGPAWNRFDCAARAVFRALPYAHRHDRAGGKSKIQ